MNQLNARSVNKRGIIALITVLVLLLMAFMVWLAGTGTQSGDERNFIAKIDDLQVLSEQIARHAKTAESGELGAFDELAAARGDFSSIFGQLVEGTQQKSFPVAVKRVDEEINAVQSVWQRVEPAAQTLIAGKDNWSGLTQQTDSLSSALSSLESIYGEAKMQLLASRASARQVAQLSDQLWHVERSQRYLQQLSEGEIAESAATALTGQLKILVDRHEGLVRGGGQAGVVQVTVPDVVAMLQAADEPLKRLKDSTQTLAESGLARARLDAAADSIAKDTAQLRTATAALSDGFDRLLKEQLYARLAIGLIILAVLAFIVYRRIDSRLKKQSQANAKNQEAILRLLDELADLADGDLTVSATVTEDFTGAIADSINYAIDQLRSLVVSINSNSVQVSQAADESRATAHYLSEASNRQASAITQVTGRINDIVSSMDEVAGSADESAKVAENSVQIANKGAGAVQNTIHGMDKIREQIQKTSKQIKRLGESSQEIGDIISLINDIADQTNILSLNAAIQASMAGDAGRGFAVVADEVQRLAERSGAATRQIEVLVKTIQADTNEAVISMEQTTAEVVQGARLAQDAGVALEEIEEVSNSIAKLIQDISQAAGLQSKAAVEISETMGLIQEITHQTSSGTDDTARSIGKLAEMATEMRNSVSGFTLPEDEGISLAGDKATSADKVDDPAQTQADTEQNEEATGESKPGQAA